MIKLFDSDERFLYNIVIITIWEDGMTKRGLISAAVMALFTAVVLTGCEKKTHLTEYPDAGVIVTDKKVVAMTQQGIKKNILAQVDSDGNATYEDAETGETLAVEREGDVLTIAGGYSEENAGTGETGTGNESAGGQTPSDSSGSQDETGELSEPEEETGNKQEEQPAVFTAADYTGVHLHTTCAYSNAEEAYSFINAVCSKHMSELEIVTTLYNAVARDDGDANAELHNLCNYAGIESHQCVAVRGSGKTSGYQPLEIMVDGIWGYYAPYENIHGGYNGNVFNANKADTLAFLRKKDAEFVEAGLGEYCVDIVRIGMGY